MDSPDSQLHLHHLSAVPGVLQSIAALPALELQKLYSLEVLNITEP